jgi:hypothetical protein
MIGAGSVAATVDGAAKLEAVLGGRVMGGAVLGGRVVVADAIVPGPGLVGTVVPEVVAAIVEPALSDEQAPAVSAMETTSTATDRLRRVSLGHLMREGVIVDESRTN